MADFEIEGTTLKAHNCLWDIVKVVKFDHRGIERTEIQARKKKGRIVYAMVIYENGTISPPV